MGDLANFSVHEHNMPSLVAGGSGFVAPEPILQLPDSRQKMIKAEKIKDGEREMVKPATEGTRNVLAAVNEAGGIIRVVLAFSSGVPDLGFLIVDIRDVAATYTFDR
ncbi:hypothetical protein DL767_001756 [Monosporascus sp. MG133]|nr:hypothetical protein DL767_001756 [Monosporascus sp. MG133]